MRRAHVTNVRRLGLQAIESLCELVSYGYNSKVAIGTRCKRAGMHWTVAGANAIIALRCCKLSGRFEEFWERRAQRRVA